MEVRCNWHLHEKTKVATLINNTLRFLKLLNESEKVIFKHQNNFTITTFGNNTNICVVVENSQNIFKIFMFGMDTKYSSN